MKDKKIRNIFVIVFALICVVLVIIFRLSGGDKQNTNDNSKDYVSTYKEITSIKKDESGNIIDYKSYFSIITLMQLYDEKLNYDDGAFLIDILDKEYLMKNTLNSSNIINMLNPDYYTFTRYVNNIVYKYTNDNCYFFVETIGTKFVFDDQGVEKLGKENFVVVVDLHNLTYYISPLNEVNDIPGYINNYNYSKRIIEKNDHNSFIFDYPKDTKILSYYISFINTLLYVDENQARNYINNYDPLLISDYINKTSNLIYSYKKEELDNMNRYSGTLLDGAKFNIYDYSPMNFKIDIE